MTKALETALAEGRARNRKQYARIIEAHLLLEDALKVIDVQRAHLSGIDGMRASQDLAARGFANIRERILAVLKETRP